MIYLTEVSPAWKVSGLSSIICSFDFDPKIVSALKTIPNYYYHKTKKVWEIPVNYLTLLVDTLTFLDDITLKLWDQPEISEISKTDLTEDEIKAFKLPPYKHQLEAINYGLRERDSDGWLLLDSMGLGKSYTIMCIAETLKRRGLIKHCLIITGIDALRSNWYSECKKFSNESVMVLGRKESKSGKISYASIKERIEILKKPIDEFFVVMNISALRDPAIVKAINKSKQFGMIAFDEAHRGSRKSQMGNNLMDLEAKYKIAATGTPFLNNPLSIFVPLNWTKNDSSCMTTFKSQYCQFGGFNDSQIVGYKNLDLLKDELENCSLRRTLNDVRDMPPKTIEYTIIDMDDSHRQFYERVKEGVKEERDKVELNASNLLALTTRLRQATSCPSFISPDAPASSKIQRCIELVEDIVDSGEKVVILALFKETIEVLKQHFGKFAKFRFSVNTGDISENEFSGNIERFQSDPSEKVFIGTWSKCGTGITLNAAQYLICIDVPWTWGYFSQGVDRCYRVNNTKPLFVTVLACADTIDEKVLEIIQNKKELSDYIIDNINNDLAQNTENESMMRVLQAL